MSDGELWLEIDFLSESLVPLLDRRSYSKLSASPGQGIFHSEVLVAELGPLAVGNGYAIVIFGS